MALYPHQASGVILAWALILSATALAKVPENLPEAEKAIADTVDPWGLSFSDQLTRFQQRFTPQPKATFCIGVTHDLVKVLPNKYWFRGPSFLPFAPPTRRAPERWAAAGETQSFQVAVLPRTGAPRATYKITAEVQGADQRVPVEVFREVFVTTAEPAYPRLAGDRWPDPLLPSAEVTVSGLDAGVFWVDVKLPPDQPSGEVAVRVQVTDGRQTAGCVVPIRVVGGLKLDPKAYPFVGWFRPQYMGKRKLSDRQFRDMCALVLEHHLQPIDALVGRWDEKDPAKFDEFFDFLRDRGQAIFQLDKPGPPAFEALYRHVKATGRLSQCVIYSNADEPDAETFRTKNIPFCREMHQKYPGLRVYLASEYHPHMEQGCDIWMTDISSHTYDPEGMRDLQEPELWHYYCHLPVRWQMRAPLTLAPNMQIDNPALEHRLALWVSRYYGAKGVFIWAGFSARGIPEDFWETLKLSDKPSGFPYAGIHNGNNYRVYPPQTEDGPVLPSVRLKVTRDALEDLALFAEAERLLAEGKLPPEQAEKLRQLLDPTPAVFVHPQYFDRLPETLLARRRAILRTLAEALEPSGPA